LEKKVILFFSDIKYADRRSAFNFILPLFNELQKTDHIILAPNSAEYNSKSIVSFKAPFFKSKILPLRLLSEILMPIFAVFALLTSNWKEIGRIQKIIIYSPSIFTVLLLIIIKFFLNKRVESYLILRDIFPDWAVDSGIINNKYIISFFRFFAQLQFVRFDHIGVQDDDAIIYLKKNYKIKGKLGVLKNWMSEVRFKEYIPNIYPWQSKFREDRLNLVYTGNLGPAQNSTDLFKAFHLLAGQSELNLSVHIFGNGSEYENLQAYSLETDSLEIFFWGSVSNQECDAALTKCDGGFFCLNTKLTTNNIPGKYINYIKYSLPVFAVLNKNNPTITEINSNNIGIAVSDIGLNEIALNLKAYVDKLSDKTFSNPRNFFDDNYSFKNASKPLLDWLKQ
jgi:hypothetical protein